MILKSVFLKSQYKRNYTNFDLDSVSLVHSRRKIPKRGFFRLETRDLGRRNLAVTRSKLIFSEILGER